MPRTLLTALDNKGHDLGIRGYSAYRLSFPELHPSRIAVLIERLLTELLDITLGSV